MFAFSLLQQEDAAPKAVSAGQPGSKPAASLPSDALPALSTDAAARGILSGLSQSAAALGLARLASWGLRGSQNVDDSLTAGMYHSAVLILVWMSKVHV
jgi:hypothetical protein